MILTHLSTAANSSARHRATTRWLDRVAYPVPDPLDTQAQYDQYVHTDLQGRAPAELCRELGRVRLRLLLEERPPHWLHERAAAIRAARRARRARL